MQSRRLPDTRCENRCSVLQQNLDRREMPLRSSDHERRSTMLPDLVKINWVALRRELNRSPSNNALDELFDACLVGRGSTLKLAS